MKLYAAIVMFCMVLAGCGATTTTMTIQPDVADPNVGVVATATIVIPTMTALVAKIPQPSLATDVIPTMVTVPTESANDLPLLPTILPTDWTTVEWEGLSIPIPSHHVWEPIVGTPVLNTTLPIITQAGMRYDQASDPEIRIETPSGFVFAILRFNGSLQEWLTQEQNSGSISVDQQTVRETTVAGQSALVYNPLVTGTGFIQQYIVDRGEGRLMWISTDIVYPGYEDVIAGIRFKE